MEDTLKEILYELKSIRMELEKRPAPRRVEVKIDDDVIANDVIKKINSENRISKHGLISV